MGNKEKAFSNINWWVVIPAVAVMLIVMVLCMANPEAMLGQSNNILNFFLNNFSWLILLVTFLLFVFAIVVAFSKYGNIRIGGENAKPNMSFFSWFCIALTSGIAVGIIFYCVYSPLDFFINPPPFLGIEGGTSEALDRALPYAMFHWGVLEYGMFAAVGLCIVLMVYNGKRKFKISSGLYPLIGDKCDGKIGHFVDSWSIFAMVGAMAPCVGLATMQMLKGISYAAGTELGNNLNYLIVVVVVTICYVSAAISGLHKGIKYVSQANVYIYLGMLFFTLLVGGTIFILNNSVSALSHYLSDFFEMSLYMEPTQNTGWTQGWTGFYFVWFLCNAPIMGLIYTKLAKGRTLRQFVLVNIFGPSIFTFIWFSIFGGAALNLQFFGKADIFAEMVTHGPEVALFALARQLPGGEVLIIVGIIGLAISLITALESVTLTLADCSTKTGLDLNNDQSAPKSLNLLWGILMAVVGYVMLVGGGISGLQTIAVACGAPTIILVVLLIVAFVKSLIQWDRYDLIRYEPAEKELPQPPKE